jgi:hypothetical protein
MDYTFLNGYVAGQWGARVAGGNEEDGASIVVDSTGIYAFGNYTTNPATIYNSDGSIFGTLPRTGSPSNFLVKYNTAGFAQWATRIGNTTGNNTAVSVSTDGTGIYVTGYYGANAAVVYNADGTTFATLPYVGGFDTYMVKYNFSGFAQWATRISGTGSDYSANIKCDKNGNVYLTGYYNSASLTFFNSDGTTFATTLSSTNNSAYICQYSSAGFVQWVTKIVSLVDTYGQGVVVDDTGVYTTGYFQSTGTVYQSDGSVYTTLTGAVGSYNGYLVKYDASGFGVWSTTINNVQPKSIALDATGLYLSGQYFVDPVTIFNSDGSTFGTLPATLIRNGFVIKYNLTGFGQWYSLQGGAATTMSGCVHANGNAVYVAGFYNSASLTVKNADSTIFETLVNSGSNDAFLVKYTQSGVALWAARLAQTQNDVAAGITSDGVGGVYVTGSYRTNPLTVYNSNGAASSVVLPNSGANDAFIVKYNENVFASLADASSVLSKVISNVDMNGAIANISVNNLIYQAAPKTTILLSYNGDSIELGWNGSFWYVISLNGAVIV